MLRQLRLRLLYIIEQRTGSTNGGIVFARCKAKRTQILAAEITLYQRGGGIGGKLPVV